MLQETEIDAEWRNNHGSQEGNLPLGQLRQACVLFAPLAIGEKQFVKCPYCQDNIPSGGLWQHLFRVTNAVGQAIEGGPKFWITVPIPSKSKAPYAEDDLSSVLLRWMQCPNDACREIIVVARQLRHWNKTEPDFTQAPPWIVVPRHSSPRPLHALVTEPHRTDYIEASRILADSPRMSAVLARKILADLLEMYGAVKRSLKLSKMIDDFIAQGTHPSHVTDNLHYLREIGDFAAHTQKDELGNVVNVEDGEPEWTLNVVDTLFDYFIVAPETNRQKRSNFDGKLEKTRRKAIKNTP